jgi:hypothetical protein
VEFTGTMRLATDGITENPVLVDGVAMISLPALT